MRWRLSPTADVQKTNTYREASEPRHIVNCEHFHAPHPSEISGGNPGSHVNAADMHRGMMEIHPATLGPQFRESTPFGQGMATGYRPAGSFSASSRNSGTEGQLQAAQNMPADNSGDYYR